MIYSNFEIKQKAFFSIIVPCYNAENTIVSTLESVERQSFSEFELIIVNDGSTDSTNSLIEKKLMTSKINYTYINQKNQGVSVARNRALKEAKGEYIVFLDADDIYHRNYLEILYDNISNYSVETVFCSYSRDIQSMIKSGDCKTYNIVKLNHQELLEFFMYRKGPSSFFTFAYQKKILDEFQIFFNEKLKYGEDLEFIWNYLIHVQSGLFVEKDLYGYYDNPNSAINNIDWRATDVFIAITNIENNLKKINDEFYITYKNYMFPRTMWAVLKDFSFNGNKDYFSKITKDYEVIQCMKVLQCNAGDWKIKFTAKLFLISESAFFNFFKSINLFERKVRGVKWRSLSQKRK